MKCWQLDFLQIKGTVMFVSVYDLSYLNLSEAHFETVFQHLKVWHHRIFLRRTCNSFQACCIATNLEIFDGQFSGISSRVCGDQNRYCKLKHALLLTLTECFLCLNLSTAHNQNQNCTIKECKVLYNHSWWWIGNIIFASSCEVHFISYPLHN